MAIELLNRHRRPDGSKIDNSKYNFDQDGLYCEIGREKANIIGGQRALLMQAAYNGVGKSVFDHGDLFKEPFGRLVSTVRFIDAMLFATQKEFHTFQADVNNRHAKVVGKIPETGEDYRALDPKAQTWVFATFVDTAILFHDLFIRRLSPAEKESVYQESKRMLPLLRGRSEDAPPTYPKLQAYINQMIESGEVRVNDRAREIAQLVLLHEPLKVPHVPFRLPLEYPGIPFERLTAATLHDDLVSGYGMRLGPHDRDRLEKFGKASRAAFQYVAPIVPRRIRFSTGHRLSEKGRRMKAEFGYKDVQVFPPMKLPAAA